jgi:hypothetical protein
LKLLVPESENSPEKTVEGCHECKKPDSGFNNKPEYLCKAAGIMLINKNAHSAVK